MAEHESTREADKRLDKRGVQHLDRLRDAMDGRDARAVKRSKKAKSNGGPDDLVTRVPFRREATEDPRSMRSEVTVRVSLIDGSDRLVYVDVRDGRGWKQPLALEQVASELRHRPPAIDGVSLSEPRTVRTVEAVEMARPLASPDRVNSMFISKTPTPYSLGKANVTANASLRHPQRSLSAPSKARAPAPRAQATVKAPTRSR